MSIILVKMKLYIIIISVLFLELFDLKNLILHKKKKKEKKHNRRNLIVM